MIITSEYIRAKGGFQAQGKSSQDVICKHTFQHTFKEKVFNPLS